MTEYHISILTELYHEKDPQQQGAIAARFFQDISTPLVRELLENVTLFALATNPFNRSVDNIAHAMSEVTGTQVTVDIQDEEVLVTLTPGVTGGQLQRSKQDDTEDDDESHNFIAWLWEVLMGAAAGATLGGTAGAVAGNPVGGGVAGAAGGALAGAWYHESENHFKHDPSDPNDPCNDPFLLC
jgi:hypothetical protein